jgi:hypothetical protein
MFMLMDFPDYFCMVGFLTAMELLQYDSAIHEILGRFFEERIKFFIMGQKNLY